MKMARHERGRVPRAAAVERDLAYLARLSVRYTTIGNPLDAWQLDDWPDPAGDAFPLFVRRAARWNPDTACVVNRIAAGVGGPRQIVRMLWHVADLTIRAREASVVEFRLIVLVGAPGRQGQRYRHEVQRLCGHVPGSQRSRTLGRPFYAGDTILIRAARDPARPAALGRPVLYRNTRRAARRARQRAARRAERRVALGGPECRPGGPECRPGGQPGGSLGPAQN